MHARFLREPQTQTDLLDKYFRTIRVISNPHSNRSCLLQTQYDKNTKNIVYCIICITCNKLYVGETNFDIRTATFIHYPETDCDIRTGTTFQHAHTRQPADHHLRGRFRLAHEAETSQRKKMDQHSPNEKTERSQRKMRKLELELCSLNQCIFLYI